MANINFVNKMSTSVRVINGANIAPNSESSPYNHLRLEPGDWLIIEILGGVPLPMGCYIELHKDFNFNFLPEDPPDLNTNKIVDTIRTIKTGPHTPEWSLKITNTNMKLMKLSAEENVTVGENQN